MPDPLRLAVITDIHHGRVSFTKQGPEALRLLTDALETIDGGGYDLVVELGDRISDVDRDTDLGLAADVASAFAETRTRRRHIVGNHDVAHLTGADNEELFGTPTSHDSIDLAGFHLVLWQMNTSVRPDVGFAADPEDLAWLADDLASTDLPAVVFSHIPLDGGSLRGNYWFQNNERYGGVSNVDEIQSVLHGAGNVALCVAGHVHRNQLNTIDGAHHLTVQSLTDSYTTGGEACGAWATLELAADQVRWTTHGLDPIAMTLPLRSVGTHWQSPLPPFHTIRR
jgi:hypothetical protein